jgi:hypothetical protein
MNILTGLGYFFTGMGLFVLFVALFIGSTAYNAVSSTPNNPNTGNQLGQGAFLYAFAPYGVTSGVLMFLGVVFAIAENSRKSGDVSVNPAISTSTHYDDKSLIAQAEVKFPNIVQKPPSYPLDENKLPLPNLGICPSCNSPIIFIEKYQFWYCINERKYIQSVW